MGSEQVIRHQGVIREIKGGVIFVEIVVEPACHSCQAKSGCSLAESESKMLEIDSPAGDFAVNEIVDVVMQQTQGYQAVLLGYIFPLIMFLVGISIAVIFSDNELIIGLTGLGVLVPSYFILFLFRKRIKRSFLFKIEKVSYP